MSDSRHNGSNAAIYYLPQGYSTNIGRLMGINVASEGFVRGFTRFAGVDTVYCVVEDDAGAAAFSEAVHQERPELGIRAFLARRPELLSEPGCLYLPGPGLSEFAWQRRFVPQRSFSLCGITHATASGIVMDAIADFAIAPIQAWDALICTSQAVRGMVQTILDGQMSYLRERLGATTFGVPQMPVIPLGIDAETFTPDAAERKSWRQSLGISDEDIAILHFGRLSFQGKSHPIPLYRAMAAATQQCGSRFHLIQAGWFPSDTHEALYREAGRELCPTVNLIFLDGRDRRVRTSIWAAADIFTSLVDNIQESFGLTPLEAMAASLPVVVSDWDGYRDTVRHGIDGYLIPTLMAPAPFGGDLAYQHGFGAINYDSYIGKTAQFVAVDIEACATAFATLAKDRDLRREMGAEGRQRVRRLYDWSVIVPAYQEFWAELAQIRSFAQESAPPGSRGPVRPNRPDPFQAFAGYPTARLDIDDFVVRTPNSRWLEVIMESPMVSFAAGSLPTETESRQILDRIADGPVRVREIVEQFSVGRQALISRGIVWLAKFGLVRVIRQDSSSLNG